MRFLISLMILALSSDAATYYVRTDGNNSNTGLANTSGGAWLTIQKAATTMTSGDSVQVQAGTYNERIAVTVSGASSNSWINFVGNGQVVCRGFDLTAVSYIRLIGFEITHTNATYSYGIRFISGVCSHIDIIDNYIHEIQEGGVRMESASSVSWMTCRGNTLYYMGFVPGVVTNFNNVGFNSIGAPNHNLLIEYNVVQRVSDVFIQIAGTNNIARNNYCWDFRNSYWGGDDSVHSDIFQEGSDGVNVGSINHLYERNFTGDCIETNSHFGIWIDSKGDTNTWGDFNQLLRGNVGYNFGSGGIGVMASKKVATYNNTFYDMINKVLSGGDFTYFKYSTETVFPTNGLVANALISIVGDLTQDTIAIQAGSYGTYATNNMGYLCHSSPSFISTSDPKFVDPTTPVRNFRFQSSSPARATGTNVIWITSSNGSGTTFNVNDGLLLIDGWGMVDGDTVTIGATTTHVTSITSNAVTVAASVTWTNGQAVHWGGYLSEDLGALPYGSTEMTWAQITNSGTTYTVTPTGDARGVWFYVDGIPTTWTSTSPYQATIASGTVTAKAYALYAQSVPVLTASTGPPPVTTGTLNLRGSAVIRKGSFQ